MLLLVIGLVLFLGIHSLAMIAPAGRSKLIARFGPTGYRIGYGLIALAGFVLIIYGYGQARLSPTVLYQSPQWLQHVNMLLMLLVFPALLAAYLPGRIQKMLKHPMLIAVKAWALAHLLVNGTLAAVLLFGGFLVWAIADRISLNRRKPRKIPQLPGSNFNDIIAVVAGLGIYVAFAFWLHPILIGVPVMP